MADIPRYPFWGVENNYVINVNHIVWFQKHSDQTLTICLSSAGPKGSQQIQISDKAAINDFLTIISTPAKPTT